MKKNNILKAAFAACVALVIMGCNNPDDVIKSITYPIQPSPVNFKSTETSSESVTLEWGTLSVADSCIVELFANDEDMTLANDPNSTPTVSKVVYGSPATIDELESQMTYSARIKAVGSQGTSKYTVIEKVFKTSKSTKKQTASLAFNVDEGVKATYEFGCITLTTNNGNSKMAVDANTQYFNPSEPVSYTARLKTGGSSSDTNGITFKSTGTGTLKIAVRSSSSTATRKLTVKLGDTAVQVFSVADTNSSVVSIEGVDKTVYNIYEVSIDSGTYTLEYDGGINFYGFDVEYVQ